MTSNYHDEDDKTIKMFISEDIERSDESDVDFFKNYLIGEICIKSDKLLQETVEFNSEVETTRTMEEDIIIEEQVEEYGEEFYLEEFKAEEKPNECVKQETLPQKQTYLRTPCYICAKLISKKNMLLHLKTHNECNDNFKCDRCEKSFKIKSYLNSHIMNVHVADKKFQCNMCGKSYSKKTTYMEHLKTHTGSDLQNFNCQVCSKKFAYKKRLDVHMRIHQGVRPFECNFENCSRTFIHQTDLRRHKMSQHTLERPYKCHNCDHKGFVKRSQLQSHSKRCQ